MQGIEADDMRQDISRRTLLAAAAALPIAVAANTPALAGPRRAFVRRGDAKWPDAASWQRLGREVGGTLAPVTMPNVPAADAARLFSNPYFLRDEAALTQSSGWIDAWRSEPSAYAIRARHAGDVAAAIHFARRTGVRLVVRGGGHSYLGNSSAPDSLLLWTRDMNAVEVHEAFVPQGASKPPVQAVSLGAGCIWRDAYDAVTTRGGRYVQGGGCMTVGVAGLVQGGGFGSFSKRYGLAAASLLEAEVVTADGKRRIVSEGREPHLFWALKGGGGGTFGVVTRLTLRTHELPAEFGLVRWSVRATSDEALRSLVATFVDLYSERLFNPHWGEQAGITPGRRFDVTMLFQGIDREAAEAAWRPIRDLVDAHGSDYQVEQQFTVAALPARRMWDVSFLRQHLPSVLAGDGRAGAPPENVWWASNTTEAGTFWHGYESAWLPASLLDPVRRGSLVDAWIAASRRWSVTLHFNKGLAGAADEARLGARATSMNPAVLGAFALAIIADDGRSAYLGLSAAELAEARNDSGAIGAAMGMLRRVAPDAGSYVSECDYHLADWQSACWGENWPRLAAIKRGYDPEGLFLVHHGVGSER